MLDPLTEPPIPRIALTPTECAEALAISERHLSTLTKQGVIPCVRLGNSPRYPVDVVREALRELALRDSAEGPSTENPP